VARGVAPGSESITPTGDRSVWMCSNGSPGYCSVVPVDDAATGPRSGTPAIRGVLFDRDGTLVHDVPYNGDPALVAPVVGARAVLDRLRAAGLPVGVVTNQSGIGRGLLTLAQVRAVNAAVEEQLGPFDTWQVCPHAPEDGCPCRKPAPGMVVAGAAALGLPTSAVAVIGDIGADVEAARAAGAYGMLVPTPVTLPAEVEAAPVVAPDLSAAVDRLLALRTDATSPSGRPSSPTRSAVVTKVLAVRLDSVGDVILTGPALRLLRAGLPADGELDLLASPAGAAAGRLLPEVDDVLVIDPPWEGQHPAAVDPVKISALIDELRDRRYDEVVIFTSYHQSPLPFALVARLAGVRRIVGTSDAHAGTLLDVRHRRGSAEPGHVIPDDDGGPDGGHEVIAAQRLVEAIGRTVGSSADTRLAVRRPLPDVTDLLGEAANRPYVVVHPGASVPSRAASPTRIRGFVAALLDDGWSVVITGSPLERHLTAAVRGAGAVDLGGRTDLAELAAVLDSATCAVVGNTGPAHLAAAVGTPVVSLFAPVVPAERWAPWGVPSAVLGDQQAPCRLSRARTCPVPGHPCLDTIEAADVVAAVQSLVGARTAAGLEPVGP
jgi:histidinol-phosphate phosphatase family protein